VNSKRCLAVTLAFGHAAFALAQPVPQTPALPVTADNYNRAQTDVYFGQTVQAGALGKFRHGRELAPIVNRGIVRPNRDTLYSFAVFDFDAGPVTAYSVNNITAKKNADGSVAVQFGGCDGKISNCLPTVPADSAGLELHGAALSSARRNPERQVEFPEAQFVN
jgi:hypothetical protein